MPHFRLKSIFPVSASELYGWHMRIGALERLTPPWSAIEVTWGDETVRNGSRRELLVPAGPLRIKWLAKHHSIIEGRQFIDEQERGPFRKWVHLHLCTDRPDGRSELEDRIEYEFPLGKIGQLFGSPQVNWIVNTSFPWRHERTWMDLSRHAEFLDRPRLKVAITGASGLIGRNLTNFLTTGGHTVVPMLRTRGGNGIYWNPQRGEIESEKLEGFDVVVHLAGKNVGDGRWSERVKHEILESRTQGTGLLAKTLAGLKHPPGVLISASGTGIYKFGDDARSEDGPQGDTFLAEVVRSWEAAADPARQAGIRVVHPRIAMVLSGWGGALKKLLLPFKLGVGGRVGSGRQMMSWIHIDDLLAVLYRAMYDERLSGPVNVASGEAVTNAEFTKLLGRVLRRPAVAPLPEFVVNTVFGEMGRELLLGSLNVEPRKLNEVGFKPWFSSLEAALRFETGKPFPHSPPFHPAPLPQSGANGYLIS